MSTNGKTFIVLLQWKTKTPCKVSWNIRIRYQDLDIRREEMKCVLCGYFFELISHVPPTSLYSKHSYRVKFSKKSNTEDSDSSLSSVGRTAVPVLTRNAEERRQKTPGHSPRGEVLPLRSRTFSFLFALPCSPLSTGSTRLAVDRLGLGCGPAVRTGSSSNKLHRPAHPAVGGGGRGEKKRA